MREVLIEAWRRWLSVVLRELHLRLPVTLVLKKLMLLLLEHEVVVVLLLKLRGVKHGLGLRDQLLRLREEVWSLLLKVLSGLLEHATEVLLITLLAQIIKRLL